MSIQPKKRKITNLLKWKRVNGHAKWTKVYIVSRGYRDLIADLDERGWVPNDDPKSMCFNMKWMVKCGDIPFSKINNQCVVNHFRGNGAITTKIGLCRSIKNLIWFNNIDIDTFFPRCFDLNDVDDYQDFVEEYKALQVNQLALN
jgi:tubulin monoglycylase TTLL3/8